MSTVSLCRRDRIRSRFIAALLLFVVVRALIPVGFMPAVVGGATQLVFCDGSAGAAHHGHPGHQAHAGSRDSARSGGPCPFAASGGAAPLTAGLAFTFGDVVPSFVAAAVGPLPVAAAPHRHTAPRGPPTPA